MEKLEKGTWVGSYITVESGEYSATLRKPSEQEIIERIKELTTMRRDIIRDREWEKAHRFLHDYSMLGPLKAAVEEAQIDIEKLSANWRRANLSMNTESKVRASEPIFTGYCIGRWHQKVSEDAPGPATGLNEETNKLTPEQESILESLKSADSKISPDESIGNLREWGNSIVCSETSSVVDLKHSKPSKQTWELQRDLLAVYKGFKNVVSAKYTQCLGTSGNTLVVTWDKYRERRDLNGINEQMGKALGISLFQKELIKGLKTNAQKAKCSLRFEYLNTPGQFTEYIYKSDITEKLEELKKQEKCLYTLMGDGEIGELYRLKDVEQ